MHKVLCAERPYSHHSTQHSSQLKFNEPFHPPFRHPSSVIRSFILLFLLLLLLAYIIRPHLALSFHFWLAISLVHSIDSFFFSVVHASRIIMHRCLAVGSCCNHIVHCITHNKKAERKRNHMFTISLFGNSMRLLFICLYIITHAPKHTER